jgi:hypothetical protein
MKPVRATLALVVVSTLGACAAGQSRDMVTTDTFLRNALDAYGVIDVVPATTTIGGQGAGAPLDATNAPQRTGTGTVTLSQACKGKTGIRPRLLDAATRRLRVRCRRLMERNSEADISSSASG